jgi:sulfide:quinone oxidoreductase
MPALGFARDDWGMSKGHAPRGEGDRRLPRVLVAGGGVTAAETVLALGSLAPRLARVELLAPQEHLTLVQSSTASPFAPEGTEELVHIPLADLAAHAGASLQKGALAAVDAGRRRVRTASGAQIGYDVLIVAIGARPTPYLGDPVLSFRGPADVPAYRRLLDLIEAGALRGIVTRLAIVVPPGPTWALPAYELALLTAAHLEQPGVRARVQLTLVTAEDGPLAAFGPRASESVAEDLARAGVAVRAGSVVRRWAWGQLELIPEGQLVVDRVVALPSLRGPATPGLPVDAHGFIRTDAQGRVEGLEDVFAVGDAGTFPVKQGGIGCQQADVAATLVARRLGADVEPAEFVPTLRGLLRTDGRSRFLRADLAGGRDESAGVTSDRDALWWPPQKVAGRFLTPYLAGTGAGTELADMAPYTASPA